MAPDILVTMQQDLERSLRRPDGARRWVMLIDLRKCVGCHACTIACQVENKLPPQLYYRPVHEYETGKYPNPSRAFLPRPCMHCDNPPCVKVCPVPQTPKERATWKETEGLGAGLVKINYDTCIGCAACVPACPYEARTMDEGKFYDPSPQGYETAASYEYGVKRTRKAGDAPIGNARKCHFCLHRLAGGMLPECVTTCIGRATYYGDANDSTSLVAQLIKANKTQFLKARKGTKPRVYYISDKNLEVIHG